MEVSPKKTGKTDSSLESLGELYTDHSGICSKVCRQIVFALFAIVWTMSYHDGLFDFTWSAWMTMGLLVFYLFADVSQYLCTAYLCSRLAHSLETITGLMGGTPPVKTQEDYDKTLRKSNYRISRISSRLFYAKIILLGLGFIFLLVTLGQRIACQEAAFSTPTEQPTATRTADSAEPA